jgi:hypothetical protein
VPNAADLGRVECNRPPFSAAVDIADLEAEVGVPAQQLRRHGRRAADRKAEGIRDLDMGAVGQEARHRRPSRCAALTPRTSPACQSDSKPLLCT